MQNNKYALILALGLAVTSSTTKAQSESLDNNQITDKKVIHLMKAIDAGAQADWGDPIKKGVEVVNISKNKMVRILHTNNPEIKDIERNIFRSFRDYWQTICRHAIIPEYVDISNQETLAVSRCTIKVINDFMKTYDEFFDENEN